MLRLHFPLPDIYMKISKNSISVAEGPLKLVPLGIVENLVPLGPHF